MATKKIDDGIRAYLDSLGKSDKPVVDREAAKSLKAQIKTETDQLNKLKLIVALQEEEKGRAPDHSGDRAVFVAEAKAWADAEGVTAEAFQTLGVPDEDLKEAGFSVSAASQRVRARSGGGGTRAARIPLEEVRAAASKLGAQWKLTDLAAAIDRDVATVRNYVSKLIEAGDVKIIGDDSAHDGRGRAPKVYTSA